MLNRKSIFQKVSSLVVTIIALGVIILASLIFVNSRNNANAAPVLDFKPGRIIEDSVFTNSVSMTPAQIQSFLNAKVPNCDTWGTQPSEFGGGTRRQWAEARGYSPPYTCLKDFSENGLSAAQIIYNVSQQYQINPQVLIVLLQKEQGLVTDTWPTSNQYRSATGYGCPDTAPCNSLYYGLTNQISWSAKMFRAILNNSPNWYTPYNLGNNFIRWSPNSSCGGSNVYIENRSTQALYNYTPYQPNASALNAGYGTGDACGAYGNRNFYLYFRDWFGYNSGPAAFKTADSPTVYVPVEGYKMAVSSMALLNDYGISSSSIQTVTQSYLDARPTPAANTGLSGSIAYLVKSPNDTDEDGGSVYLISRGKRYQIQTMTQFFSFGFKENQIAFLPLSYVFSLPNGGFLQNYITSPSSEVFKVDENGKHLFFDYPTYIKSNPTDSVSAFSYNLVDSLVSGDPITDGPALVKYNDSSAVYVYQNGTYYLAPDYATFSQCWGLDNYLKMPINTPSQNGYIKQISSNSALNCVINDGTNNLLLNGSSKLVIPTGAGLSGQTVNNDLKSLASKLPTKSQPLSSYVKTSDNASVWFIENGKKYLIPSYSNLVLLGAKDADIDTINSTTLSQLTDSGLKLANGSLVKSNTSGAVYVIYNNQRILFPSGELFNSYSGSWSGIETYLQATLDAQYPFSGKVLSEYLADSTKGKAYIIGQNGCYELSTNTYTAFNTNYSTILNNQPYGDILFKNVTANCVPATQFVKTPSSSLVYWVSGGTKRPISSYAKMVSQNGGTSPRIIEVTSPLLESLPTGATL